MKSLFSSKNDDAEIAAVMVGTLAVFFSLAVMLIVSLSEYSMGSDFANRAPEFSPGMVATNQP
jgi:hypothetical protein